MLSKFSVIMSFVKLRQERQWNGRDSLREKTCLASVISFCYSLLCCSGQAIERHKNGRKAVRAWGFFSSMSMEWEVTDLTLKQLIWQLWIARVTLVETLFVPAVLTAERAGAAPGWRSFRHNIKNSIGSCSWDVKWASGQSTCGWMLLESVSGNYWCIYSTVKKGSRKYL